MMWARHLATKYWSSLIPWKTWYVRFENFTSLCICVCTYHISFWDMQKWARSAFETAMLSFQNLLLFQCFEESYFTKSSVKCFVWFYQIFLVSSFQRVPNLNVLTVSNMKVGRLIFCWKNIFYSGTEFILIYFSEIVFHLNDKAAFN